MIASRRLGLSARKLCLFALPFALAQAPFAAASGAPPPSAPASSAPKPAPAAAASTSLSSSGAAPRSSPSGAPAMTVDTLENGLTVVTVPLPGSGVVALYTLVRAGSRDEVEKGRSGYAHLFEHLMFRGTTKTPAAEYERRMQAMGADNNAFTTGDFTLYVPTVPKESLADLVAIEADRFQHLDVAEDAYKDETGAVNGELNKSMSSPGWLMNEALHEVAFQKHTYGHTTIGYQRDVVAMPKNYAYSKTFFSRFYTPDDCAIWAVGDVDHAKVMELVRANYSQWKGKRAQPKIDVEPEQKEARQKALVWKGPTTPRLLMGYKTPSAAANLKDVAALAVATTLVFGEPGDLYQKLVVHDQKLIELSADPDDVLNKDPGLLPIEAKLKAQTTFESVVDAVQAALDAVARGEAKPEGVEAARTHLISAMTLQMQTPGSVAQYLAMLAAVTGDVRGFERYLAELRAVTPSDVARVVKAYLIPTRRTAITLSPRAAPPDTAKRAADDKSDPKAKPAPAAKSVAATKPVKGAKK